MTPGTGPRCVEQSRRADEPLAGTAPHAQRWVCVEHAGPWTPTIAADPDRGIVTFAERAAAEGWRLVLIRRPGSRGPVGRSRVYLADTSPAESRLTTLAVDDLREIELTVAHGDPAPRPLLLVCGHGARDQCCVLDGRPLAVAVAESGADVWECTHLGGHRFAPSAVVLPTGFAYGRLDVSGALAAYQAADVGEMEARYCRGRTTWLSAGQIAELAVRAETGIREAAALTVDVTGPRSVEVRHNDGAVWEVRLRRRALDGARPPSCGAEPEQVSSLVAGAVERLR